MSADDLLMSDLRWLRLGCCWSSLLDAYPSRRVDRSGTQPRCGVQEGCENPTMTLLTPLGPNRFYRLGNEWQLAGFDASQLFFLRTTRQGLDIGVLADLAPSN